MRRLATLPLRILEYRRGAGSAAQNRVERQLQSVHRLVRRRSTWPMMPCAPGGNRVRPRITWRTNARRAAASPAPRPPPGTDPGMTRYFTCVSTARRIKRRIDVSATRSALRSFSGSFTSRGAISRRTISRLCGEHAARRIEDLAARRRHRTRSLACCCSARARQSFHAPAARAPPSPNGDGEQCERRVRQPDPSRANHAERAASRAADRRESVSAEENLLVGRRDVHVQTLLGDRLQVGRGSTLRESPASNRIALRLESIALSAEAAGSSRCCRTP